MISDFFKIRLGFTIWSPTIPIPALSDSVIVAARCNEI
jgi:hypothetical protein